MIRTTITPRQHPPTHTHTRSHLLGAGRVFCAEKLVGFGAAHLAAHTVWPTAEASPYSIDKPE